MTVMVMSKPEVKQEEVNQVEPGEVLTSFNVRRVDFVRGIQLVEEASASDKAKTILNSVLLHLHNGFIDFVTADGYRLHSCTCSAIDFPRDADYILNNNKYFAGAGCFTAQQVMMQAKKAKEELVCVFVYELCVGVLVGNKEYFINLVTQSYPDYKRITTEYKFTAGFTVDAQELAQAVKLAAGEGKIPEEDVINLFVNNKEIIIAPELDNKHLGAVVKIDASQLAEDKYYHQSIRAKYLLEAVKHLKGNVNIEVDKVDSPTKVSQASSYFVSYIMPNLAGNWSKLVPVYNCPECGRKVAMNKYTKELHCHACNKTF